MTKNSQPDSVDAFFRGVSAIAEEPLEQTPKLFEQLVLKSICSGVFHELCSYNLSNRDAFERIVADSYQHDNGFVKMLLAKPDGIPFRLRLHIWPAVPMVEQNVHDHRFDFWSFVMCGKLTNIEWAIQDEGTLMGHYIYSSRQGADTYELHWSGVQSLTRARQITLDTGSAYCVDKSILHTISTHGDNALTIFIEDRRFLKDHANVYSMRYENRNVRLSSPSMSLDAYKRAVSDFLERL